MKNSIRKKILESGILGFIGNLKKRRNYKSAFQKFKESKTNTGIIVLKLR